MSGNHQPKSEEAQTDSTLEAEKTVATSQDDKKVPLGELVKQRQAASEAKKAAEAAEARIKELESLLAKTEKPKGDTETVKTAKPVESDPRLQQLDDIVRKDAIRDLRDQKGLTFAQAEKVHEIQSRMPELDFDEAFAIAASRHVNLFSDDDGASAGFNPGVHGSIRPAPGAQPPASNESDMKDRISHYQKLRPQNKRQAQAVWNNMVGNIAAQQLGLQGHKLIQIPKS